jgi:O-antigen/teichoic acid export membrane protein
VLQSKVSVAKGATSLYIAIVIALLANTLYYLVLTNVLQSTLTVGIVTSLNIMIWFLVTICIFAQPVVSQSSIPAPLAVLKFLPELLAKSARSDAARVFRLSLTVAAILGAVMGGILSAFPNLLIPLLGGQVISADFVRLAAIDVVAAALGQICVGALIALEDVKSAATYIILWSLVRYAIASVLLIQYSVVGVLLGWIIGDMFLFLLALRKSIVHLRGSSSSSVLSSTELSRYWLYTLISALIGFTVNQADKIFTLASQGLQGLAVYNVAIVAANFAGFAPYALLMVLLPALSVFHSKQRTEELREMIRSYTRYVSIIVLPIAIGYAAVSGIVLRLFGPAYVSGFIPSIIVSIATGLTAVGAVYAGALLAIGEMRWYTVANLLGLVGLFFVSAISSGLLGLAGPALGRAVLMAIVAIVYALAMLKHGLLELDGKAFLSAVGSSTLMGAVVFGSLYAAQTALEKLLLFPVLVVAAAIIYVITLRVTLPLTVSDLEFARSIIPTRFSSVILKIGKLLGVEQD